MYKTVNMLCSSEIWSSIIDVCEVCKWGLEEEAGMLLTGRKHDFLLMFKNVDSNHHRVVNEPTARIVSL